MSLILPEIKSFFLHIPRTGGTWVHQAIGLCGIESNKLGVIGLHLPMKHGFLPHHKLPSDTKLAFAFVRHPIPYYESVFKWIGKGKGEIMRRRWSWHPYMSAVKFYKQVKGNWDHWLQLMLNNEPMWYTRMIEQYVGPDGGEYINYIGRTESLIDDFIECLGLLGYQSCRMVERLKGMDRPHVISKQLNWNPSIMAEVLRTESIMIRRFYEGEKITTRLYPSP